MVAAASYMNNGQGLEVGIPQSELKILFRQAEEELYRSKAFRQALAALQCAHDEQTEVQGSLQKACKEAIRLTLRQVFVASKEVLTHWAAPVAAPTLAVPTADGRSLSSQSLEVIPAAAVDDPHLDQQLTLITQAQNTQERPEPTPERKPSLPRGRRHLSKVQQAQQAQQAQQMERDEILRKLGQELHVVREARSLSVLDLHQRTMVPIHHIKALEAGQIDRLPEDIYVRGFVRQMGDALGLDGRAIARLIPLPAGTLNPVPSWYHEESNRSLNPMHLYVGYTALIAGTMGSLVWMNQQSFDPLTISEDLDWLNFFQASESSNDSRFEVTPIPNATGVDAIAPPDIASPESSPAFTSAPAPSATAAP